MPTIVISGSNIHKNIRKVECNIPCKWIGMRGIITNVYVLENPSIKLTISMEGSKYYPLLDIKKNKENFLSTTSFASEVPVPYFSFAEYDIQAPEQSFTSVEKSVLFLASNCNSMSNRENIVKELMELVPVKSLGKCLRNSYVSSGSYNTKGSIMKKYALYFSFENQIVDDYITEKLWGALASVIIPVYKGAPNIKEHIPQNSAVLVDEFSSLHDLAKHLNEILKNETLYYEYHKWRREALPEWFINKYNFTATHSECRTCIWASDKMKPKTNKTLTSIHNNYHKPVITTNKINKDFKERGFYNNIFSNTFFIIIILIHVIFYFIRKYNKKNSKNIYNTEKGV